MSVCNPSQVRVPLVSSHVFTITCVSSAEIYSGLTQVYQINHMLHFLETLRASYHLHQNTNTASCSAKQSVQSDISLLDEFGCITKMDTLRHLTALVLVVCIFVFECKGIVQSSSSVNLNLVILLVLMAFQSCMTFFQEKSLVKCSCNESEWGPGLSTSKNGIKEP